MPGMNRSAANSIGVPPRRFILLPEDPAATSGHGRRIRRFQLTPIAHGAGRGSSFAGVDSSAAPAERDPGQAGHL
jgi:hypothetical protein